jgi:sugar phosphate isomerase/epimerase
MLSRRNFLISGSGAVLAGALPSRLAAWSPTMPLSVQCYDFKDLLAKDFDGTWKSIKDAGYAMVDMVHFKGYDFDAKLGSMTAKQVLAALHKAGLTCEICHFPAAMFQQDYSGTMAFARDLGVKNVIAMADVERMKTVEDWKGTAKLMNAIGAKTKADGLPLGYHNHEFEFHDVGGVAPYDLLMSETNPSLVSFQLDVGNLAIAGKDSVAYLKKYSSRLFAAHLKDATNGKLGVAVGQGSLNWPAIFTGFKNAPAVRNYCVETGASPDQIVPTYKASVKFIRGLKIT